MARTYACPVDCGGAVLFTGAETWTDLGGQPAEFAAGACDRCRSEVLVRLSTQAIQIATERLAAAGAVT